MNPEAIKEGIVTSDDFRNNMMNGPVTRYHEAFGLVSVIKGLILLILLALFCYAIYKFYKIYQEKSQAQIIENADLKHLSTDQLLERKSKLDEELAYRKSKSALEEELAQLKKSLPNIRGLQKVLQKKKIKNIVKT
ncbi:hypothetical protein [Lactococcus garvieae]|uniref:hypothetical protein n=1 Tax=Lactococcus garvieae TaxID=1363 RepID=UPI0018D9D49D|nr:hypothetical protein [Lactococcus garvieae]QPS71689.1 hypothetical protein I6G50_03210 [Lactococcus garvieae]